MLICHTLVVSNDAAGLQACHMSDAHATGSNLGSVCHARNVRGCVPLSTSSSLIYHFWFLKHHHSAARHHQHRRSEMQLSLWHMPHGIHTRLLYFPTFINNKFLFPFN